MGDSFRVRDCLVEPQLNRIRCGQRIARVEPKAMDVLVYLTRHPNEVLPKERIIQAVWPLLSEPTPSGSSFLSFCSFASGKVEPVVEVGRPTAGLSATRDGRSVLFAQVDQEGSDLMLLENFLHWPKGTARAVAGRVLQ
jgi:hypothetical protein